MRKGQYTTDQRILMATRRIRGDSIKAINFDFKKSFPLSGRNPDRQAIERNKKKLIKEGKQFFFFWQKKYKIIKLWNFIDINNLKIRF